jgi:hypothetical protein
VAVAIGMFGARVYSAVTDVVVVASAAATISISCKIWLRLMHVKCINDLCSLLDHIFSYLIVLCGLAIDSRGFLSSRLLFGFNVFT